MNKQDLLKLEKRWLRAEVRALAAKASADVKWNEFKEIKKENINNTKVGYILNSAQQTAEIATLFYNKTERAVTKAREKYYNAL